MYAIMLLTNKNIPYESPETMPTDTYQVKSGDTFEECKQVIKTEAEQGWRLKQVVTPIDEKAGIFVPTIAYQIIFEREV